MKTKHKIEMWIHQAIRRAYVLGYQEGIRDGMEKSAYIENLGEYHDKPMETLSAPKLTQSIIKEISQDMQSGPDLPEG